MTIYNILLILFDATAKQINIKFINSIKNVIALYKILSLKDKNLKYSQCIDLLKEYNNEKGI